eukprot:s1874_g23.t1
MFPHLLTETVTLRLASKPTKRGTKFRGSVEPGLPLEAAKMALLRKDRVWDPKTFPLRKNLDREGAWWQVCVSPRGS